MKVATPFDAYPVSAKKPRHEKKKEDKEVDGPSYKIRATPVPGADKSGAKGAFKRHHDHLLLDAVARQFGDNSATV